MHLIQVTDAANICTVQRRQNAPGRHIILSCHCLQQRPVCHYDSHACHLNKQSVLLVRWMLRTSFSLGLSLSFFSLIIFHVFSALTQMVQHTFTRSQVNGSHFVFMTEKITFDPSLIPAPLLHDVSRMLCNRYSFVCLFVCLF